ncbi:MAG TPA: sulfotransferase [Candidatus Limnocylindria bacterium]|nr:sulfotransferase [Candidatus Limnocylindria bacterium]
MTAATERSRRVPSAGGQAKDDSRLVRAFIVGCPRSGTTLLQSLLKRHAPLTTVPETRFFVVDFRKRGRLKEVVQGRRALRRLAERCRVPVPGPSWRLTSAANVGAFVETLDSLARREGNRGWVEKTPEHLFYIHEIQQSTPEAQFVHVVRDGGATIASLYELSLSRPERYWRRFRSIDYCLERWNAAVGGARRWLASPNHHLVRYEELADQPAVVVAGLCREIGVPYGPDGKAQVNGSVEFVLPHETWSRRRRKKSSSTVWRSTTGSLTRNSACASSEDSLSSASNRQPPVAKMVGHQQVGRSTWAATGVAVDF